MSSYFNNKEITDFLAELGNKIIEKFGHDNTQIAAWSCLSKHEKTINCYSLEIRFSNSITDQRIHDIFEDIGIIEWRFMVHPHTPFSRDSINRVTIHGKNLNKIMEVINNANNIRKK